MTVSSQVSSVSYLGDGVTTLLPVPYYFLEQTHLLVTRVNPDTSTTTLVLGSDYSVSGAGVQAGGSVTMFSAPAVGVQILIDRSVPATQETDYVSNDPFPAESHERALDKLTMLVQQSISALGRALLRPIGKNYYDAEGRNISNLAEPVSDADAATKGWAGRYFGDLIDGATGLINTTTGILYDAGTLFDYLRFGVSRSVDSIADLKLLSSARNQRAFVFGYYAKGDGGGGPYYIDPADTTSSDNGGTVIVANDGARWKLDRKGGVLLEQFGLKGDGVTNDTAAFQRALDSGVSPIVGRYERIYRITDTITIKTNKQELILNKGEILLDDATGLKTLLKVGGQASQTGGVRLNSIVFTRAQASTAGYAVDFDLVGVCEMEDCRVYGNNRFWRGVRITRGIIVGLHYNYIDNCINRGIYIIGTGLGADRTVDVVLHGNRVEGGITALETSDFVEGIFARENIFFNTSGIGVVIDATTNANGLASFKLQENDYDTCGGGGLYIDKVGNIQVTGCWFSAVQVYALTLGSLSDGSVITDNQLYPAAKGIISGGNSPIISNNLVSGGTNAIELGSTSNNTIAACNSLGNCSIGIFLGSAPNAMISNNNGFNFGVGMISGTHGAGTQISNNKGDAVRGTGNFITVGASPFTYTAGARPEYVSIYSGTVSQIALGANAIGFTTNRDVVLVPGQSVTVTYSSIPFMVKNFL